MFETKTFWVSMVINILGLKVRLFGGVQKSAQLPLDLGLQIAQSRSHLVVSMEWGSFCGSPCNQRPTICGMYSGP